MGCHGNCGQACCDESFPFGKWRAYNRRHQTIGALEFCLGPNNMPGFIDPATGQCVVTYPWAPEIPPGPTGPAVPGNPTAIGYCDTPSGAPGVQTPGGCIPLSDFAQQCTTPQGGPGWQLPGGPCMSAGPPGTLPPGVPDPGMALPDGVVLEAACQQREASAASNAKAKEEAKVIKYAAITGVVSAVVGLAVGKLF